MPWLPGLLQLIVLWGGTAAVIVIDKQVRKGKPVDGLPPAEPGLGVLALLTLLCNILALPYYFYATRSSAAWGAVGFVLFLVLFGASGVTYAIASAIVR